MKLLCRCHPVLSGITVTVWNEYYTPNQQGAASPEHQGFHFHCKKQASFASIYWSWQRPRMRSKACCSNTRFLWRVSGPSHCTTPQAPIVPFPQKIKSTALVYVGLLVQLGLLHITVTDKGTKSINRNFLFHSLCRWRLTVLPWCQTIIEHDEHDTWSEKYRQFRRLEERRHSGFKFIPKPITCGNYSSKWVSTKHSNR